MKELLVSGLNQRQLRSGLASGKIIKIRRGLYTWRKPTPFELARIVHEKWPGIMLAGKSAVELYSKKELTFPLLCLRAPASQLHLVKSAAYASDNDL